jgi:chaperonin GroEL
MEYGKVKSVSKHIDVKGPNLRKIVAQTMRTISEVVGATLGPGGQPVLIERYEHGMPSIVTKDGVTVFRSLGFDHPTAHCVMEAARDAAVHTANEAGDGTTTATVLSEAIIRLIDEYCTKNKRVSPQRVVRHLETTFRDYIEPAIKELSVKAKLDDESGEQMLRAVATVSANGDKDLSDAVMDCFGMTGDDGNVTILEVAGPSHYETEHVQGYPILIGYEDSCAKFYNKFINDPGSQRTVLDKPAFLLYNGRINEIQQLVPLISQTVQAYERPSEFGLEKPFTHNIVIVATGYSDTVLASLGLTFEDPQSQNVFPLQVPNNSPQSNAQNEFLLDLSAVTGAPICDPIAKPLAELTLADLGVGCEMFEASRFRSTVVGFSDEFLLEQRIDELKQQAANPESQLDQLYLNERIAKLSSGIARLKVFGSSNVELKEKRDRAEDAVCAVRGAIKHGCLPGGAWTLLKLCQILPRNDINDAILRRAFLAPFDRLMVNSGIVLESAEASQIIEKILLGIKEDKPVVYDFLESKHVDPYAGGILDSTPAVLEAIRNAISIASLLGTLGGVVVFNRDGELERSEARASAQWAREANMNPADDRP